MAITRDYKEKTWEIGYRGGQRTYDFEGEMLNRNPLAEDIPDVDDLGTGYIWTDVARHGLTHRNYGEFVATDWCDRGNTGASPKSGTPLAPQGACREKVVRKGRPLPPNVGAVTARLFSGPRNQPPFTADYRNEKEGLVYHMDSPKPLGAKESARMDFVHADQANAAELNRILWRERIGNVPMPKPRHVLFR